MSRSQTKAIIESMQWVYAAPMAVRWRDMDAFGHVNNSVYFTYFEQARVLWWQQINLATRNLQTGPVVASANCDFLKPLHQPADIKVNVFVGPPGRSSYTIYYEIVDQNTPELIYARGSTAIVWIDYKTGKSIPLPDEMRACLPEAPIK